MSKIVEKIFDANKRIIKSIFKGSPNLFTTADLNRQIDAFKYQLDQSDDKTGFYSDFNATASLQGSTLNVSYSYTYMNIKGCSFSPAKNPLSIGVSNISKIYVLLTATTRLVTSDNDATHEISGVKFQDGSTKAAADNMVYENATVVLSSTISDNTIGVLAIIEIFKDNDNKIVVTNNTSTRTDPLRNEPIIRQLSENQSVTGIKNGDTYEEAFNKVNSAIVNLFPAPKTLTHRDTSIHGVSSNIEMEVISLVTYDILRFKVSFTITDVGTYMDLICVISEEMLNYIPKGYYFSVVGALQKGGGPNSESLSTCIVFNRFYDYSNDPSVRGRLTIAPEIRENSDYVLRFDVIVPKSDN